LLHQLNKIKGKLKLRHLIEMNSKKRCRLLLNLKMIQKRRSLKTNNQFKLAVWKKLVQDKIWEINQVFSIIMDQEKNKPDLFLLRKAQKINKTQFKNQTQLKWILKSKLIIMHLLQNKKMQILIWVTRQM
jgi:hypothetical protein